MPALSTLRLTLRPDTDGTAELFVEAASAGFAGRASAWFNVREIAEFAQALNAFPLPADDPPRLQGGFSEATRGKPTVVQEHVFLEIRRAGKRGTLAVEVRLATPHWNGDPPSARRRAAFTFLTDYRALQGFASAVGSLAAGTTDEALMASDVDQV